MMYPTDIQCPVRSHVCTPAAAYVVVYAQGNRCWTPLMAAARYGRARCIHVLVEYVPKVI